jgi:hypothetical protein
MSEAKWITDCRVWARILLDSVKGKPIENKVRLWIKVLAKAVKRNDQRSAHYIAKQMRALTF